MNQIVKKLVNDQKQVTISLTSLEKQIRKTMKNEVGPLFYKELADAILNLEREGVIEPIKSAKSYSRDMRVRDRYRKIIVSNFDENELKQELLTSFHQEISVTYYLKNLDKYQDIRGYVKSISDFLKTSDEKKYFLSANERSYELFGDEKFLCGRRGKSLLINLKISYKDLYCFETFEPFFHIGLAKNEHENILIVENLDTFFSLKKLYNENVCSWNGIDFSMIVYGEGNKITKSFCHLDELNVPENVNIYYFGDFDREGINIYHRLSKMSKRTVKLMKPFYEEMYRRRKNKLSSKKQNLNESAIKFFFEENKFDEEAEMREYLTIGKYVPQEAVNIEVMRRIADGVRKPL